MKPKVSIILCTYNAEKFIAPTLESLINQTYPNIEILILDNDSKDNTVKLIKKIRKKSQKINLYESEFNYGPYQGLNFLIDESKGKYIAIQDHDDIWHPKKIEKQINFLENEKNKKYIGCGSNSINYYEKYDKFKKKKKKAENNIARHTTLVFRNKKQKYNTKIKIHTDQDFMKNRLCNNTKRIYNIDEYLVLSRIRADNNNLSDLWITRKQIGKYLKNPFFKKKNLFSKIYTIYSIIIPNKIKYYLSIKVLSRRHYFSKKNAKKNHPQLIKYILEEKQ